MIIEVEKTDEIIERDIQRIRKVAKQIKGINIGDAVQILWDDASRTIQKPVALNSRNIETKGKTLGFFQGIWHNPDTEVTYIFVSYETMDGVSQTISSIPLAEVRSVQVLRLVEKMNGLGRYS